MAGSQRGNTHPTPSSGSSGIEHQPLIVRDLRQLSGLPQARRLADNQLGRHLDLAHSRALAGEWGRYYEHHPVVLAGQMQPALRWLQRRQARGLDA